VILLLVCGFLFYLRVTQKKVDLQFIDNRKTTVDCSLKDEIDSNMCKFLNFQFPYSTDEISKRLFTKSSMSIKKLGLESLSRIQGIILGYQYSDDDVLLIVGFDGKENSRFVSLLRLPLSVIRDENTRVYFNIYALKSLDLNGEKDILKLKDNSEIKKYLDVLVNKLAIFVLIDDPISDVDMAKASNNKAELNLANDINGQLEYTKGILGKVFDNGLNSQYSNDYTNKVFLINQKNDALKIDLKSIPVFLGMFVNLNSDEVK